MLRWRLGKWVRARRLPRSKPQSSGDARRGRNESDAPAAGEPAAGEPDAGGNVEADTTLEATSDNAPLATTSEAATGCGDAAPAGSLASVQIRRRRAKSPLNSLDRDRGRTPEPRLNSPDEGEAKPEKKTVADSKLPESMLAYWESLKDGRRYPSCGDLDPNKIAQLWPSCVVLNLGVGTRQAQVERSFS